MPLTEMLMLSVGPAIAKSILKLWLKEDVTVSAASSLVDVFTSRTRDVRAQQRGRRQFEDIGEQVAESLLPVFEAESGRMDAGEREAIALALAETLNKSKISAELLAEQNLNPKILADSLNDAAPDATRDFSAMGTSLYQRVLSESCQCIVDIAAQLPRFTERTFAEVLKRENQLLDVAQKTLAEVQRIREASEKANPEEQERQFEEDYRREIVRTLDRLELFGADLSEASRRHRLSVAYVTLSVKQTATTTIAEAADAASSDADDNWNIVSVDEALAKARYLLVRGLAGSGKTTLLQWVAVRSASRDFGEQLAEWNDVLPFFVRLRQFWQGNLPRPEEFPGIIAPTIAGTVPGNNWVHKQLKSGRAVVLIDGIDEIPDARREDVRQWIQGLVANFPGARFLVTGRPHALEEGWLAREGFEDAELQEMEPADIYAFIDHWHEAVREELQEDKKKAELEPLAARLKQTVEDRRSIRNLATSPLLCAMLCALHRDRRGEIQDISKDRIALYDACCEMLINRRDVERRIPTEGYPPLTSRQRRILLEDIAYWMLRNKYTSISLEEVREHLEPRVADLQGLPPGTEAERVLRLLVERTGIVREPVKGQLDFTHRTFQEFLAAKEALDQDDIGLLIQNAHDDQWREAILLAVGLAKGKAGDRIIRGLMERGDAEEPVRHPLYLLAVACLETAVELSAETKADVAKRLAAVVPPKNFTEAAAVASAGELAIPYLTANVNNKATVAAACVRALAYIGGEAALRALEGYRNDWRETVRTELGRAWDHFDRKEYARRVLGQRRSVLRLNRVRSLEGIELLTGLTQFGLSNSQVRDLAPLASLTKLTLLNLYYCPQVSDLSPLAGLTKLIHLSLSVCWQVSDLSPLTGLSNLTQLDIIYCHQVSDLSPLAGLNNLTQLDLSHCQQVRDLSPLAGLNNLTQLDLRHHLMRDFSLLTGLNNLTQLKRLNLSQCYQVNDLSPLIGLTNLTQLDLSYCLQVSDLSPLAGLTKLTMLNLSACEQVSDLSPLAGLTKLTRLDLTGLPPHVQRQWKRKGT